MTEETKGAQNSCCTGGKAVSTLLKMLLGLVFLALGVAALIRWWPLLLMIIKGGIGLFLILAGIITMAIAKE